MDAADAESDFLPEAEADEEDLDILPLMEPLMELKKPVPESMSEIVLLCWVGDRMCCCE